MTTTNKPFTATMLNDFIIKNFATGFSQGVNHKNIPAVNIRESKTEYNIELAAPGLSKADFKISFDNKLLTVSSTTDQKETSADESIILKEFKSNDFSRSFKLPENSNTGKINATYSNGILYISIPKEEEKPAVEIKIN